MTNRTPTESTICPACSGTQWHNNRLCHRCEISTEQANNLILDRARGRGGSMSPADAVAAFDEFENRGPMPVLHWDEDLGAYQFEDGGETGIWVLPTTTDALNLLWQGHKPSYEQMHKLGDDWGFRTLILRGDGPDVPIHTGDYRELPTSREPECFEPRYGITDAGRCLVQRLQFGARIEKIERDLETCSLSRAKVNSEPWDDLSAGALEAIKATEAHLETEHAALKNMLGLPDAELLECLAELDGVRAVAS